MKEISCVSELMGSPVLKCESRFTVSELHDAAHPLFCLTRQKLFLQTRKNPVLKQTRSKIESDGLKSEFIYYVKSVSRASTFPLEHLTNRTTAFLNSAVKLYYETLMLVQPRMLLIL